MNNNLEIYSLIEKAIIQRATPGVSYAILGPDENETHYLGFLTYDHQERVNSRSIYDLASLTKVVGVTTRILQMLAYNQISLKDEIAKYLPDVSCKGITIKNLLIHNSGLPADLNNIYSYKSSADVISAVKSIEPISELGEKVIYSDINFVLLGLIIEEIDKVSLDKSIDKNIIQPLKMKNTGYNLNKPVQLFVPTEYNSARGLIKGKVHDETAFQLNGVSGNAGLFSSLTDLEKFCLMYLNKGKYNGKDIIPFKEISELFNYNFEGRTLGWARWAKNKKFIWHTGFTGTSIGIDLERKRAFICLTNRVYPTRENQSWNKIRRELMTLFFEEEENI